MGEGGSVPVITINLAPFQLATCSHAISHAQLDEVAYKFFTMGCSNTENASAEAASSSSSYHNFFLANPTTATHIFAVSQVILGEREERMGHLGKWTAIEEDNLRGDDVGVEIVSTAADGDDKTV